MLGVEVARIISNIKKNRVWTNSSRSFVNMKVQPDSHFFFLPFAPRLGCESGSILGICSAYKIPALKDLTPVLD